MEKLIFSELCHGGVEIIMIFYLFLKQNSMLWRITILSW